MRKNWATMVLAVFFLFACSAQAQLFTRVTEGDHVSSKLGSRSVAWVDADDDGDLDLFTSTTDGKSQLFENDGAGLFSAWSAGDLTSSSYESDGASWADMDNDGDLDVFIANWGDQSNRLYLGNGDGTWSLDAASPASSDNGYSEAGSWGDYDADGFVDLYVANSAGANTNFLYKNESGTLVRDSEHILVTASSAKSRSVSWVDWNGDGRLDLLVGNEGPSANDPFQQLGDGSFVRVDSSALATKLQESMSTSWGDIDNDGDLDLFVANLNDQPNRLWENMGNGYFVIRNDNPFKTDNGYSFSSAFGDFDNDGDLDLFVSNGWDENNVVKRSNFLYENDGNGAFSARSDESVTTDLGWSYGASWGDGDGDGDLDLYVSKWYRNSEENAYYRNESAPTSWVQFDLEGTTSNRSAIGTTVRVKAMLNGEATWQMRVIEGQNAYCSQNLRLHFGLADATVIDSLVIEWPSGTVDQFTQVAPNQCYTIEEGLGYSSVGEVRRSTLPERFQLDPVWPNPFNATAQVKFHLTDRAEISLIVTDLAGRQVATLATGEYSAGSHRMAWQPAQGVASGVYFALLRSESGSMARRMVLVK